MKKQKVGSSHVGKSHINPDRIINDIVLLTETLQFLFSANSFIYGFKKGALSQRF